MTATRETAKGRALLRALGVVLFGGTALVILHDWFGVGGAGLDYAANGPIYDAVVVAAGLVCLVRALHAEHERGA